MPKTALATFLPHLGRLGRATRWRRTRGRPRIWAHRGDSANAPENTMLAFDKAAAAGADGIELDVQLDADHHVVVFHDDSLDRLCGRAGRIQDLAATERVTLRVRGEPIPLLAEVLHSFDVEVNVEIKSQKTGRMGELVAATAKVIKESGRADQIVVSSFDPIALVQLHRHLPDVALAYLFHEDQALPMRRGWVGNWTGASLVHPQHTLCTEQSVKRWHTAGMPINAWTVDDPNELKRLALLGIDGVFCNDVAHAVKILSSP
ncbi:MAG: glycerophosphodiester phosphodiesterase [Deltaproteobacteria bacterium]|nr:glycerophosphodiester phosphodiesterase [Deltaproteobacteria bacterium]MDQ3301303.1 glycerophosphodiester phosphodiesterase [Myxococcota bacterium]